jgi:hypothetical protein
MKLLSLLAEKKTSLTDRWLQRLFESYSRTTAIFLKKETNRFDNPMGHQLSQGLGHILEALLQEADREQVIAALDEVIRVRALQNFSPSQALAFLFLLKNVIREELAQELKGGQFSEELQEVESRIDGMALLGFEVYTERREKLCEIRVTEIKQRVSSFMRSKGMDINSF